MSNGAGCAPLSGVRVLDLSRLLPGPVATLHLADLGADVIKIEDHGAGDYARTMGEGADGVSVFYRAVNRNKRGLRLDLKKPEGRDAFLRLAKQADIVVESFRPGVTAKLGIDYHAVSAVNPKIVYCAISGYGQTGSLSLAAGHDLNYIALTGILDQIGVSGGAPAIPNLQIGDLLGGALSGVMGILAALFDAQRSGKGRFVDVAMSEAAMAHALFPLFAMQGSSGLVERGCDMLSGGDPAYGVYATADDRYMAVAALEEKFWKIFCATVRRPDLVARHGLRGEEAQTLRRDLEALFLTKTQQQWCAMFADADCCVTPVLNLVEALQHPHFVARQMAVQADGVTQLAPPVKLTDWEFSVRCNAPVAGEHSSDILGEAGFSDAEIDRLRSLAVI